MLNCTCAYIHTHKFANVAVLVLEKKWIRCGSTGL